MEFISQFGCQDLLSDSKSLLFSIFDLGGHTMFWRRQFITNDKDAQSCGTKSAWARHFSLQLQARNFKGKYLEKTRSIKCAIKLIKI